MLSINSPEIVTEVTACVEAYERALVANDVEALRDFFWDSSHAIRYGATEQLYGAEEITAFRQARVVNFAERLPLRLTVTALGTELAVAMLEFSVRTARAHRHGRQTQVWAKVSSHRWQITHAHVSYLPEPSSLSLPFAPADVQAQAAVLGLSLDPAHLPGVVQNLQMIASMVAPLMDIDLPPEIEIAPVFVP
ncbi:MAG TPA: DUF3225 domain-containing protein [Opitutaceae bacterium]|nr:DUF3225 domain-containing protein [Opitutaceae bacterium]